MDAQITFRSEQRLTQEEFFEWLQERPDSDVNRYELIHGRIVMTPPADFIHGGIEANVVYLLRAHIEGTRIGRVLGSSVGYDLPSGDTLEPDASFVSKERLAAGPPPERSRHARLVPDLVVEILSRSTARRDRTVKKDVYAANGVREYWIVDPDRRNVRIFHAEGIVFDDGELFSRGTFTSRVLLGLSIALADLFAE